jgi:hypothetical protein
MVRIERHCSLLRAQRLLFPTQVEQRIAAVGDGRMASERLGPLERLNCLLKAAFVVKQDATHVVSLVVVRFSR